MATITPPYADPGRAAFEELDTYVQNFLLSGPHPVLAPAYTYNADAATVLAQFTVVGLDGSNEIVAADISDVDPANWIVPIGVLAHAVAANDGRAHVWYQGAFNMDALVWDASFDSDAKKLAAFFGAPSPTQITVAKRA